ncbi:MAG: 2-oxoglutarate and iron-dependent oxygenase domain-containing protein, partial [Acidimicrobiales bacterium]
HRLRHTATAHGRMIPTVSLADPGAGDALVAAFRRYGFASIVDHGIDPELRRAVFAQSKAFHALPNEAKSKIALDRRHRGYIAPDVSTDRASTVEAAERPNRSASFMMMREDGPDSEPVARGLYLAGPNQWPTGLPAFRSTLEEYHDRMVDLGRRVVRLFEISLGLATGQLLSAFELPTTWLRLLHYPPVAPDEDPMLFGSAPHRDFGAFTLLAQDDVGGLEVRTTDGAEPAVELDVSELVSMSATCCRTGQTGNCCRPRIGSTIAGAAQRYSVLPFFDPSVDTVIELSDVCVERAGGQAKYGSCRCSPTSYADSSASYDRHQPADRTDP